MLLSTEDTSFNVQYGYLLGLSSNKDTSLDRWQYNCLPKIIIKKKNVADL